MSWNRRFSFAAFLLAIIAANLEAQVVPPGDPEPLLRLEAGGPTSFISAMQWSADGKRLYAAGFDKVVRVWTLNERTKEWQLERVSYRIPIGPGLDGAINALALSSDDKWLAVAGQAVVRGGAGFRIPGLILPKIGTFTDAMWLDMGMIYVFNTANQEIRVLRGHRGPVLSLAFAPGHDKKAPQLISAARDWDKDQNQFVGEAKLWTLEGSGAELAAVSGLPSKDLRPGIAAWHTGAEPKQVRVALAWEDGYFRIWDAARPPEAVAKVQESGWVMEGDVAKYPVRYNNSIVMLAPDTIVTASERSAIQDRQTMGTQIRKWQVAADGRPVADDNPLSVFTSDQQNGTYYFPRTMAAASSNANDRDLLAIVLRVAQSVVKDGKQVLNQTDRLALVDAKTGEVKGQHELWTASGKMPVLAASPAGHFIAVAGNRNHTIQVFAVADVLKGGAKAQIVRSAGQARGSAAFVKKGEARGILLANALRPVRATTPPAPRQNDSVFDISTGKLTREFDGWNIESPDMGAWKAEQVRDGEGRFKQPFEIVVDDGTKQRTVRKPLDLKEAEVVTDFVLLPPRKPWNVPLLAVAYVDLASGQPWLILFNADTGEQLRQFTGHTERINSLAFAADGRLLVSASEDQTVCVWSLAKLEKYLGKLGMLPGIAVRNAFVVSEVNRNDPAVQNLRPFDVIEGVVADGKRRTYSTLRGMYAALPRNTSDGKVTLLVRGPDGQERERVTLTLGSNWDERSRGWLLGLGVSHPAEIVALGEATELLCPIPSIQLKHIPVVAQVRDDSPAKDSLGVGDLIEGIVAAQDKVRPFASARDFYETIAQRKPRDKATLQIHGKGRAVVVIGQGSDERKPLFSLFVTRPRADGADEWVGWSPTGPYEASARKAERHIGWHFNTGDPLHPASFALADEYRKEFYRDGILAMLVRHTDLAPALKEWNKRELRKPLPQARLTLGIDETKRNAADIVGREVIIAHQSPVTIQLAVDDLPVEHIAAVRYQVDGGPPAEFPRGSGRAYETRVDLRRGPHQVRALVTTLEEKPQVFIKDVRIELAPPAPTVALRSPKQEVVAAKAYRFQAEVAAAESSEPVLVTVTHTNAGRKIAERKWTMEKSDQAKPLAIALDASLEPGENLFEVVAVNSSADASRLEMARATASVVFQPPMKSPPPVVTLTQVVAVGVDDTSSPRLRIEPGQPVIVHSPRVRVEGRIASNETLATAEWRDADQPPKPIDGFAADKKELVLEQPMEFTPGVHIIAVRAKGGTSEPSEARLTIEYRPLLPDVAIVSPSDGTLFYDEGKGEVSFNVTGAIQKKNAYPAQIELLVDGQPAGTVNHDQAEWSMPATMQKPGTHRIQLNVKNEWNMRTSTTPVVVNVRRPPYAVEFDLREAKDGVLTSAKPLIDIVARVRSPLPLVPESVEAEVNETEIGNYELVSAAELQDPQKRLAIRLKNVPLQTGDNKVVLWVSNVEARCRQPGEVIIRYVPPMDPPARPEVEIVEPANDLNVTESDITVRVRVKSPTPLKRIDIVRGGLAPYRTTADMRELKQTAPNEYELRQVVPLQPRANPIHFSVVNDGGENKAAVVVNYMRRPVRLNITGLQPWRAAGATISPQVMPDGKIVFPTAPHGRMTLTGSVQWSKEDDEQLRRLSMVRVYVNGFQQIPAELQPASGDERTRQFRADLLLGRASSNQVEIELPDLKQDVSNRREFRLDCSQPQQGQRLHLLVVGVGDLDEKSISSQALLALRASRDKDEIRTPAFSQVRIYGPLTGLVTPEHVFTQLCLMKKTIDLLASEGSTNDVVMIFYQGAETVRGDGNFFETSVSKFDRELRRSAVTFQGLRGFFDDTLGAKLLLLDVKRLAIDKSARNELANLTDDTFFGVFHNRPAQPTDANAAELLGIMKQAIDRNLGVVGAVGQEVAMLFKSLPRSSYDWYVRPSLAETLIGPQK